MLVNVVDVKFGRALVAGLLHVAMRLVIGANLKGSVARLLGKKDGPAQVILVSHAVMRGNVVSVKDHTAKEEL